MNKTFRFVAFGLAFMLGLHSQAQAMYQTLSEPSIATPADFPSAAREQITAALRLADAKFLGGAALNSFTSLNYAGDTRALNLFIEALAKCPGVTVSVSFVADSSLDATCAWQVSHQADPMAFNVRVNLKSPEISLEKLVVPAIKGPSLPEKS